MTNIDLGCLGENTFKMWCNIAGITVNSSTEMDRTGWDMFVEFPHVVNNDIPIDSQPPPIKCQIQIKSTVQTSKTNNNQAKLSTLLELATSHMPVFFCFIDFNHQGVVQKAYLVHIGEELIEKILKRVRKLSVKDKEKQLNKEKLTIPRKEEDLFKNLDGLELKRKIEDSIPQGMSAYVRSKLDFLNSVGFEHGSHLLQIWVKGNIQSMIDLSLGLKSSVEVSKASIYHNRFSIPIKQNDIDLTEARLSLKVKGEPIFLEIKERKGDKPIAKFSGTMYLPIPSLKFSTHQFKMRLSTTFFDIIYTVSTMDISLNEDNIYSSVKIDELIGIFNFLTFGFESLSPLRLEARRENKEGTAFICKLSSSEIKEFFFSCKKFQKQNILELRKLLLDSYYLLKEFNINPFNIFIRLNSLKEKSESINAVANLLRNLRDPSKFLFKITLEKKII